MPPQTVNPPEAEQKHQELLLESPWRVLPTQTAHSARAVQGPLLKSQCGLLQTQTVHAVEMMPEPLLESHCWVLPTQTVQEAMPELVLESRWCEQRAHTRAHAALLSQAMHAPLQEKQLLESQC